MFTRTATAYYQGFGKEGTGKITTQSGVLDATPYGFATRFGDEPGTNPEELVAAAHAACFTMALSFALAREGRSEGSLETTARVRIEQDGEGWKVTRSDLTLNARVSGIDAQRFAEIADQAKATCPISRLLNAEVSLEHKLNPS